MKDPVTTPPAIARELQRIQTTAAPVRERVLLSIREAITKGWYAPGQRLIEREICELTGVSRTSVREALRQLESEGFVELVPNRGPIVAEVTIKDASELYQVRGALEALAGRLCAQNATDDQIEEIVAAVDEIEATVYRGDVGELLPLKDRFYDALFTAADNSAMVKMLTGLHGRITLLRSRSLGQEGRPSETLAELRVIAEAIVERDGDAAATACAVHVARAAELAIGTLKQEAAASSEA